MDEFEKSESTWFVDEVLPHETDLRNWIAKRFSVITDVDDLVQEAYARLIKTHESGPIVNPRAFLFVVTRNLAMNRIRRYNKGVAKTDDFDPINVVDQSIIPSEEAAQSEEVQILIQAIQSLPDRCRQVMTLRKIYGLTQKEVSKVLGISENTVETQGTIGLKKCVKYFQKLGYQTRK